MVIRQLQMHLYIYIYKCNYVNSNVIALPCGNNYVTVMYLHYSNIIMLWYYNYVTVRTNKAAKCEVFMNCSKNIICILRNKYNCLKWNAKGIINVKEKILLTNVEYLGCQSSMDISIFIDIHGCTFSIVIGINKETQS